MAKRRSLPSSAEISEEVLSKFKAIIVLTDAFCKRHLNEEYVRMCRRLALALARKRPSPLARGSKEVWACGIVRTIGWANVLDDPKGSPYMKLIDIDPKFGVANSTGQGKCMAIKRMFGIGRLDVDWTLPSRLGDNPVVWKVWVNDELVDIRQESREKQEKAFHKGLIPWIPADREEGKVEHEPSEEGKAEDQPSLASVEEDLFGALFGMHQRILALLRQSSLDEEKLNLLSERIKLVIENMTDAMRQSRDLNLTKRLDSAYEEIRSYAEELTCKEGGK
jgi:hypothetical protein